MRALPLLCLVLAASPAPAAESGRWSAPEIAGLMTEARLSETSGLAPSRAVPGAWWTLNDSGNDAALELMSADGERLATLAIDGVRNVDWEDLAGFTLDGRRYLLVADTGDNGGVRDELALYVVEEPSSARDGGRTEPAWTLRFRWPDGARDCEAVAVDAARGEVLLVSKKRVPAELFRIALQPLSDDVQTATRVGLLQGITQPGAADLARNPVYGRYRSQVTAADLSPDGRTLAVLNYSAVYLYTRAGAGWNAASLQNPQRLDFPWMPQAEAVAFSLDGRELTVAGEQTPSPLLRYRRLP